MQIHFETDSASTLEMKNAHNTMLTTFKDLIILENYYGPFQMDVWGLKYSYLLESYKISIECERGFITIKVINDANEWFTPSLIYSEAKYSHFADIEKDVFQLIELTHKAITENEIVFYPSQEI